MTIQRHESAPPGSFERRDDGRYVLGFERHLRDPIERVWAALTEPDELIGWLAEAELELVRGGLVELRWLNSDDEGNRAIGRGTVTRLEPPSRLEIDTDIHGLLRWELGEEDGGCRLTFTNVTPAPQDFLTKVLAGWHIHLDHLEDALGGRPVDWALWTPERPARSSGASWADHEQAYARRVADARSSG